MPNEREQFCADSFDRFLAHRLGIASRVWEPVSRGQDPPDFFLTIDQENFAVEVTSTEVMRGVSFGEGQIQEETYEHSHTQFIKDVEAAARNAGILKGAYAISFGRPMAISRFRQIRRYAQGQLLQYLERTQHLQSAPDEDIRYGNRRICHIFKAHDQRNIIYEAFTDLAWTESPEVTDKVCDLLQAAVTEKKEKVLAKGQVDPRVLSLPKILLLLNTYAFADRSIYLSCVQSVESLDFFHSVFVIWGDGSCMLLFTGNEAWSRAAQN